MKTCNKRQKLNYWVLLSFKRSKWSHTKWHLGIEVIFWLIYSWPFMWQFLFCRESYLQKQHLNHWKFSTANSIDFESQQLQQNRSHSVKGHRKGDRNWLAFLFYTILFEVTFGHLKRCDRDVAERISLINASTGTICNRPEKK